MLYDQIQRKGKSIESCESGYVPRSEMNTSCLDIIYKSQKWITYNKFTFYREKYESISPYPIAIKLYCTNVHGIKRFMGFVYSSPWKPKGTIEDEILDELWLLKLRFWWN